MKYIDSWLGGLGLDYLIPKLKSNGITTPKKLANVTLRDMFDFGIEDPDDRKKLYFLIQRLQTILKNRSEENGKNLEDNDEFNTPDNAVGLSSSLDNEEDLKILRQKHKQSTTQQITTTTAVATDTITGTNNSSTENSPIKENIGYSINTDRSINNQPYSDISMIRDKNIQNQLEKVKKTVIDPSTHTSLSSKRFQTRHMNMSNQSTYDTEDTSFIPSNEMSPNMYRRSNNNDNNLSQNTYNSSMDFPDTDSLLEQKINLLMQNNKSSQNVHDTMKSPGIHQPLPPEFLDSPALSPQGLLTHSTSLRTYGNGSGNLSSREKFSQLLASSEDSQDNYTHRNNGNSNKNKSKPVYSFPDIDNNDDNDLDLDRREEETILSARNNPRQQQIHKPSSYSSSSSTCISNSVYGDQSSSNHHSTETNIQSRPATTSAQNSILITNMNNPSSSTTNIMNPAADMAIRVVVRKRPISKNELHRGDYDVLEIDDNGQVYVHEPKIKVDLTKVIETQSFIFDDAFEADETNELIYSRTIGHLVPFVFEGGKASCFAYGQTGSGKTFTMMGSDPESPSSVTENAGLYVLAARDIFQMITLPTYNVLVVYISCFEIYSGKLFDLLNERNPIKCLEDAKQQVQLPGLSEHEVKNVGELLDMMSKAHSYRSIAATGTNAVSSRSHQIMQITLKEYKKVSGNTSNSSIPGQYSIGNHRRKSMAQNQMSSLVLRGKLSFIDLAGSERGADTNHASKQTRLEGAEINTSLLALKEVIRSLEKKHGHTPFRGSKLTQVLKDSFIGEKSRTCMIACVSPSHSNCEHTLNTLRYADRVKEHQASSTSHTTGTGGGGGVSSIPNSIKEEEEEDDDTDNDDIDITSNYSSHITDKDTTDKNRNMKQKLRDVIEEEILSPRGGNTKITNLPTKSVNIKPGYSSARTNMSDDSGIYNTGIAYSTSNSTSTNIGTNTTSNNTDVRRPGTTNSIPVVKRMISASSILPSKHELHMNNDVIYTGIENESGSFTPTKKSSNRRQSISNTRPSTTTNTTNTTSITSTATTTTTTTNTNTSSGVTNGSRLRPPSTRLSLEPPIKNNYIKESNNNNNNSSSNGNDTSTSTVTNGGLGSKIPGRRQSITGGGAKPMTASTSATTNTSANTATTMNQQTKGSLTPTKRGVSTTTTADIQCKSSSPTSPIINKSSLSSRAPPINTSKQQQQHALPIVAMNTNNINNNNNNNTMSSSDDDTALISARLQEDSSYNKVYLNRVVELLKSHKCSISVMVEAMKQEMELIQTMENAEDRELEEYVDSLESILLFKNNTITDLRIKLQKFQIYRESYR